MEERGADAPGREGGASGAAWAEAMPLVRPVWVPVSEAALHILAHAAGWKELTAPSPLPAWTQSPGTLRPHWLLQAPHNISLGLAY